MSAPAPAPLRARLVRWFVAHGEWLWAPTLMAFVTFWLYRTVFIAPDGGKIAVLGWDCLESFWPDLAWYAGALANGEAPLWNPWDRGGFAAYGDPHIGLYYPVTWAFVAPGAALGGMPPWTIQVKALAHIAIAGTLLHAYVRSRGLPRAAAALAGVVYIVAVPTALHKASALCWPMAWTPLVWIAIDRLVERVDRPGGWRRAAGLAGALGVAGAAGPPMGFLFLLVTALVYGALRVVQALVAARREGGAPALKARARRLGLGVGLAGAGALALLLVVVLPGLFLAGDSATRAGDVRNLAYATSGGMSPGPALAGMVTPAGGLLETYMGLAALALVVLALVARPLADRGVPVTFTGLAGFLMVLSFGAHTPVLPWVVKHVPGFALFREPNRYKCIAVMLLCVVAAHGLAALWAGAEARARRRTLIQLAVAVGLAGLGLALVGAFGSTPRKLPVGVGFSSVILVALAALGVALVLVPARFRAAVGAALVGLVYMDGASYGDPHVKVREAQVDDQADRRWLADLGDVSREWRIYDEFVMEQRPGSRLRVRDFRGYPSGDPFDDKRYAAVRARLGGVPELLGAYNVRWVLHGPHHRNGRTKNHIQRAPSLTRPEHFRRVNDKLYEVVGAAPLVLWYGAIQKADAQRALDYVAQQERLPGGRRLAIVESKDVPASLEETIAALGGARTRGAPAPVPGRLVRYEANEIVFDVDAPDAGLVVLNEKMAPGWRVKVDGKPAVGLRANYLLRAVPVTAGTHRIVWSYHPPRWAGLFGLWLAGVGFVTAAGVSGWRERRRQREPRASAEPLRAE